MNKLVSTVYCAQISAEITRITHHGLAKVWMGIYGTNFKYANGKWYENKTDKWIEVQHESYMKMYLRSTLTYDFTKIMTNMVNSINESTDKKNCAKQIGFYAHIFGVIDKDTFISAVLRECAELAYVNENHSFCNELIAKF